MTAVRLATMGGRRAPSWRHRAWATLLAALGALFVVVLSSSSDAGPATRAETLAAPSCSDDCNRKASDCLDACEEKFKNDDKARVTCKFECANKRQQCEKECG